MARVAGLGDQRRPAAAAPATSCSSCSSGRASARSACRRCAAPTTSTRSRRSGSPGSRATSTSSAASGRTSGGTRRSWCPAPTARARRRRPHRHVRLHGLALRGGLQPLLPRQGPRPVRRPGVLPGSRLAGHLRARVPGGPAERAPARRLPAGAVRARRRPPVVPAPAADAGLLGVPHGVHGPRPAARDLPGAVQPLPAQPRDRGHQQLAGLGVPRRRRDGRAGVARRDRGGRPRGAGQPDLRRELQPAAPRRPGPRQRQDHPGAGVATSAAPAGT